jgi:integrase
MSVEPFLPRGLSRVQAALYIGVPLAQFDALVRDGRMPGPRAVNGLLVWDRKLLDLAFEALPESSLPSSAAATDVQDSETLPRVVEQAGPRALGPRDGPPDQGSLAWLCEQYYASANFQRLDPRTRHVRRQILERILKRQGGNAFGLLKAQDVRLLKDENVDRPEAANGIVKALRQVFAFAIEHGLTEHNPAKEVSYLPSRGQGSHSWTIQDIKQFEQRHPVGSRARLALALMLYTGQRRSDVIGFGPANVNDGWLVFTQVKNRRRNPVTLSIPVRPELQAIIDAAPCGRETFLITGRGKPFTSNGFGNWFRRRCDEAGLPHCSAHGLRKAAAARLAELGASESEIMSITGHRTSKEVTRYTRGARQKVLAARAMSRLDASHDRKA